MILPIGIVLYFPSVSIVWHCSALKMKTLKAQIETTKVVRFIKLRRSFDTSACNTGVNRAPCLYLTPWSC